MFESLHPTRHNTGSYPNESWSHERLVAWCGGESEVDVAKFDTAVKLFEHIVNDYLDGYHPADKILGVPVWALWDGKDKAWNAVVRKCEQLVATHPGRLDASLTALKGGIEKGVDIDIELITPFVDACKWAITINAGIEEEDTL